MNLEHILFLDIETVSFVKDYSSMDLRMQALWSKKAKQIAKQEDLTEEQVAEAYADRAGIYAEFGKVVVIGLGFINHVEGGAYEIRTKTLANEDEKLLLEEFATLVKSHFNSDKSRLCAHNGKEFDFPYLCRRMIVNRIAIPPILDIQGKKPWENPHLDTMEMWKFGDYKSYISLDLLSALLNIPSPKTDIDGSQVSSVYWNDKDLNRIADYCGRDVETLVKVYLKLKSFVLKGIDE